MPLNVLVVSLLCNQFQTFHYRYSQLLDVFMHSEFMNWYMHGETDFISNYVVSRFSITEACFESQVALWCLMQMTYNCEVSLFTYLITYYPNLHFSVSFMFMNFFIPSIA